MKTLYVSDLDGTLLRSDESLSEYTIQTVNRLVEEGHYFSYATARSYYTSSKVTAGLHGKFPVIVYNGTMIIDNSNGKMMLNYGFQEEDKALLEDMIAQDVYPIVYTFVEGRERFIYLPSKCTRGMKKFLKTRKDEREMMTGNVDDLFQGDIFHYSCIDEKEKLEPLYEKYKDKYSCVFYLDMYTKEYWLEIMPKGISKANAIEELKRFLGCERVVAFGDGKNDIEMFRHADEAYATANAEEELKEVATGVIGGNDEDGVAKWLNQFVD